MSPATGEAAELPDRAALQPLLADAGEGSAVLLARVDGVTRIADSLGQAIADELLAVVASRLGAIAGSSLVRYSDDAFGMVILAGEEETMAAELRSAVRAPVNVYGREVVLDLTCGGARSDVITSPHEAVRNAEMSLRVAISSGRGTIQWFSLSLQTELLGRIEVEHELRRAIRNDELLVAYQPIFATDTMALAGFEALVRWRIDADLYLAPERFLPIAQESGLIVDLDNWVLNAACAQTVMWHAAGLPPTHVAVNVTPEEIADPGMAARVAAALERHGLPGSRLCVEVTESDLMADVPASVAGLAALRELGVRVAIDDFGTGYSSLAYLRHLPVDVLKIDMQFVRRLPDPMDVAIVDALIRLGHALGLLVLAEGVERNDQLDVLIELGCDQVQGYLVGRPQLPSELPIRTWAPRMQT